MSPSTAATPAELTLPGRHFSELVCNPRLLVIRAVFAVVVGGWLLAVLWAVTHTPATDGPLLRLGRAAIGLTLAGFVALTVYDGFARRRIVTRVQTPSELAAHLRRYAFPVLLLDSLSAYRRFAVALRWRFRGETIVLSRRIHFSELAPLDDPFEPRRLRDVADMFPPAEAPRAPLWPRLALGGLVIGIAALLIFTTLGWRSAGQVVAIGVAAAVSAQTVRQARQLFQPLVYSGNLNAAPGALVQPPETIVRRDAAFCLAVEVEPYNWQVFIAWTDKLILLHAQHPHFEAFLRVWLSNHPPPTTEQLESLGVFP